VSGKEVQLNALYAILLNIEFTSALSQSVIHVEVQWSTLRELVANAKQPRSRKGRSNESKETG